VLIHGEHRRELSGGERETTNNRMELTAAIEALKALKRPCRVHLRTDSEYLQKGISEWMPGWKRRGWKRKGGPILNLDLWQEMDELTQQHEISWEWVKAHNGIDENERCDELASQEIAKLRYE
jgi:ribonuclease HI